MRWGRRTQRGPSASHNTLRRFRLRTLQGACSSCGAVAEMHTAFMRRMQISITDEQANLIEELARAWRVSNAQVMRQIIDAVLGPGDAEADARAGILATAGILPDAPDWPQWQANVRG